MQRDYSIQKINEIQFSFEAIDANKVSLDKEFNNWNPDTYGVPQTRGDEPPYPQLLTKMVPCCPCTWG